MYQIYRADCLSILKKMKKDSVDSVITDPPYGLSIMNQKWDKFLPDRKIWKECLRVLKPGGHIAAFSSTRLYHRLAVSMEKCGFETCNMLAWLYSNGFPRGVSLSAQIDKTSNLPRPDDAFRKYLKAAIKQSDYTIRELEELCGTNGMFSHYLGRVQAQFPSYKNWKILKDALMLDSTYDNLFKKLQERKKEFQSRSKKWRNSGYFRAITGDFIHREPKSDDAKKWAGWKYGPLALRPCMESIYLGQKRPLRPMTENIASYGLGALNIDGCKVKGRDGKIRGPSNVIHDGTGHVTDLLAKTSDRAVSSLNEFPPERPFYYVPKPGEKEKIGNIHPTIKPIGLMRHLLRLLTPSGGVCLDPFMGSGTTGVACRMEGMEFIGIEKEEEYFEVARGRLIN